MTSARLTIPVSAPAATSLDLLLIEQQDWSAYTGVVTTSDMVRALRTMLYGDEYTNEMDCGMVGGAVQCLIDVYPRQRGLEYQLAASYGNLSGRSESDEVIEETINFSLTDTVIPSYPPLAISSAAWADLVYDADGNPIAAPQLTIEDGSITCPIKVHGSVNLRYTTERHRYTLTITRREDAIDAFYGAVVFGWYDGGLNWEEIELPPGIEIFEADAEAVCGYSGSGSATLIDNDDDPTDQPVTANRRSLVDYCSQEITEDSYA